MSQAGNYGVGAVISPVLTITADAGANPVSPDGAGNIDLLGGNNITTTATANTVTIDLTGTTQYALQVGNATNSLDSLALGTATQMLQSGGGAAIPAWSTTTYPATSAVGDVIYASAANTLSMLAFDATATRYLANTGGGATIPAWDQINLTNGVTGVLPVTNGGTGIADPTDHSILVGSGAAAMTALGVAGNGEIPIGSAGADPVLAVPTNGTNITWTAGAGTLQADLTATIAVTLGGTGLVSPTDHALIVGSGAAAMTELAVGATNQVLLGNTGADPSWGAVDLTTDITGILPVTNGGTGIADPTDHVILVGSGAAAMTELGVATDGQLIIGSAGADPVLATLTAGTGVSITNAAGSITINAGGVDQSNIIYVGKHGNDGNDGLTINKAKLTFGAAITAAAAGDAIWCFDDGAYVENLTFKDDIRIFAPNATLTGAHTLGASNRWEIGVLNVLTGTTGITFNRAIGAVSEVTVNNIVCAGTGIAFENLQGVLAINILGVAQIENGYLIGPTSINWVNIQFNSIRCTGTGSIFSGASTAYIRANGASIINAGAGNLTCFYSTGAETPTMSLSIASLQTDILSNITAGSTVVANIALASGTLAQVGAGVIIQGGATNIDGVPIGANTASTGDFTTVTTTNPIGVTYGGTGVADPTDHALIVGSGAAAMTELAVGATNQVLLGNTGADPSWGAVDLTTDITGTLPVTNGGTGVADPTDHSILVGSGAAAMTALGVAGNGEIPIGSAGADPVLANITGSGSIVVTNGAGTIDIGGGGISWSEVTGTSQAAAVNTGYICNNAALVTVTLPDTAALGSIVRVVGKGAGGWKIAQNAGETIYWDESTATTTGVGGSLDSTDDYDCVELLCITANTDWLVISSKGNISVT